MLQPDPSALGLCPCCGQDYTRIDRDRPVPDSRIDTYFPCGCWENQNGYRQRVCHNCKKAIHSQLIYCTDCQRKKGLLLNEPLIADNPCKNCGTAVRRPSTVCFACSTQKITNTVTTVPSGTPPTSTIPAECPVCQNSYDETVTHQSGKREFGPCGCLMNPSGYAQIGSSSGSFRQNFAGQTFCTLCQKPVQEGSYCGCRECPKCKRIRDVVLTDDHKAILKDCVCQKPSTASKLLEACGVFDSILERTIGPRCSRCKGTTVARVSARVWDCPLCDCSFNDDGSMVTVVFTADAAKASLSGTLRICNYCGCGTKGTICPDCFSKHHIMKVGGRQSGKTAKQIESIVIKMQKEEEKIARLTAALVDPNFFVKDTIKKELHAAQQELACLRHAYKDQVSLPDSPIPFPLTGRQQIQQDQEKIVRRHKEKAQTRIIIDQKMSEVVALKKLLALETDGNTKMIHEILKSIREVDKEIDGLKGKL